MADSTTTKDVMVSSGDHVGPSISSVECSSGVGRDTSTTSSQPLVAPQKYSLWGITFIMLGEWAVDLIATYFSTSSVSCRALARH